MKDNIIKNPEWYPDFVLSTDNNIYALEMRSDVLSDCGVCKGDILVVRETSSLNENAITLWKTPHGHFAMFVYDNFGDITFYNKSGIQMRFKKTEVTLIGEAFCVQKPLPR